MTRSPTPPANPDCPGGQREKDRGVARKRPRGSAKKTAGRRGKDRGVARKRPRGGAEKTAV